MSVKNILSVILMASAFMWLMPYGTFDPREPGFYMAIALAIFIQFVTVKLINRFRVKK